jgi:predicted  nucleic acid-binding Zn-ribbon protein
VKEGGRIDALHKVDQKLHHLRRIEGGYRKSIARARDAMKEDSADPVKAEKRFKKLKAKYEHRIEKLQPKIKQLTSRREELKNRHAAKG